MAIRNAAPTLLDELEQARARLAAVAKVEEELRRCGVAREGAPEWSYRQGTGDGFIRAADLLAAAMKGEVQ
jgi:hypothetical protein